jgi:hypothetical protein
MAWLRKILYTSSQEKLDRMRRDGKFFRVSPSICRELQASVDCCVLGDGYVISGVPFMAWTSKQLEAE